MNNLAPIVLFVYNRADHTKLTIEALQKNELAQESELFIYSDAAKNKNAQNSVNDVRKYIDTIDGFKNISLVKREKNWGLANSIIDGVTKIVNEYGKIIVLEDDLVTAPNFLRYMNEGLEKYQKEEKVYSITGYSFSDEIDNIDSTYFLSITSSWSWATWIDKWSVFERNTEKLEQYIKNKSNHRLFNFDNSYDYSLMAKLQLEGKLDSWAIYWYFSIFEKNGLTLYPQKSLINNTGFDGSGIHCGASKEQNNILLNYIPELTNTIEEKIEIRNSVRKILQRNKKSLVKRIINKLIRR